MEFQNSSILNFRKAYFILYKPNTILQAPVQFVCPIWNTPHTSSYLTQKRPPLWHIL
jgi:hypothetical protein